MQFNFHPRNEIHLPKKIFLSFLFVLCKRQNEIIGTQFVQCYVKWTEWTKPLALTLVTILTY